MDEDGHATTLRLQISKLDAAKRQLETAVRLYFNHGDPVSIHTLVSAGHRVLSDVNRARGGAAMLKDWMKEKVRPEMRKEVSDRMNEAENFFKHADRDADKTLDFAPRLTETWLLDACQKYHEMTQEAVPLFRVYIGWFMIGPGAQLSLTPEAERVLGPARITMKGESRASFFARALPLANLYTE